MAEQLSIEFRSSHARERTVAELELGRDYTMGSASGNDIVLQGDGIREQHVGLTPATGGLRIVPKDGAPVSINGRPIDASAALADGDWLAMGQSLFQVVLPQNVPVPAATRLAGRSVATALTIGRQPGCDLEIASPLVSRAHARLHCDAGGVTLEDLDSTNGTFVNGQRLAAPQRLRAGDRIAVAAFSYRFTGESLEPLNVSGRVGLTVEGLCKEVADRSTGKSRRLLDDIDLVIEPGEFVAIFGSTGSGKSTLLDALNGRRPATSGKVLYNGVDLQLAFDAFRSGIGYVPQQDIVHRKLGVRQALEYTARLRLPPDTSADEIDEHIGRVLAKLGLAEKALLPIDTPTPLSGGQLKRVSLAVELVANPNILFLDEVTSGLDAGTDKRMMQLFAELAADRKTVVCVTHTLENIDACHLAVLLHGGKLVYFGPPGEAADYFGVSRLSDVYELLESRSPQAWADQYRRSSLFTTYVEQRRTASTIPDAGAAIEQPVNAEPVRGFQWRQTGTLLRRHVALLATDRKNLLILLLQAPVIALVIGLVFRVEGDLPVRAVAESQIAFILVLSAIWFGTLNSAREVVKELPIYLRERAVNLGIAPYLVSKLLPLAVLCLVQCALLLGTVEAMLDLSGAFSSRLLTLFVAAMAATGMGLALSAFVDSNDKAVAMVPVLLIPQVVLSNAVVRLDDAGAWIAKCSILAYWALDAMKAVTGVEIRAARDFSGELIIPVSGAFGSDLAMLAVLGSVFLALAVFGLKRKDSRA